MKRDIARLAQDEFDVLVIGGGMFGACIAWIATLRGYSVALVEKGDFASATSANHYKFIHGGIRYLQHADVVRTRESARERSALIRTAPHLTYPLPVALPTYGHGRKGRLIMRAGMAAYDVVTFDRNRGIEDPLRRVPNGSFLSREETVRRFPGIPRDGLTGAAVFHDGQMYNPPRLVLSFVKSAVERGAVAANYVEAGQLTRTGDRVSGCILADRLGGEKIELRCRMAINAAGPWAAETHLRGLGLPLDPRPSFSRDLAFVVDRSISPTHALGCQVATHDTDALLDRGGRHLFLAPWRGKTLVGVWHKYSEASPDRLSVSREELAGFLEEVNSAYAGLDLRLDDIRIVNTGLILFGSADDQGSKTDHSFAKRSIVIDHSQQGLDGLLTVVGARATTARGVAEKTLDRVDDKLGRRGEKPPSDRIPIHGGDFRDLRALVKDIRDSVPGITDAAANALAHNYGTAWTDVLACAGPDKGAGPGAPIDGTTVLQAEVTHAIRHEMAANLADIVFRRTDMCTGGDPGGAALDVAASLAARELGWDEQIARSEKRRTQAILDNRGPWHFVPRNEDLPPGE